MFMLRILHIIVSIVNLVIFFIVCPYKYSPGLKLLRDYHKYIFTLERVLQNIGKYYHRNI